MRIAFIGQKGIPARTGGVERYVEQIAPRLARRGYEVFVYNRSDYSEEMAEPGLHICYTPSLSTKHLEALTHTITSFVDVLRRKNIDVVHLNSVGPALVTPFARLGFGIKRLLTGHRTSVVFTFHSADWEHGKWGWFARLMLKFGAACGQWTAERVVYVSRDLYTVHGRGTHGVHIPNGTDMRPSPNTEALEAYGLRKHRYILYVGRLVPHKNVHHLIEAFQKAHLDPDMKLVLIGEGAATSRYVKQIDTWIAHDSRIVRTGNQQGERLRQLFSHAGAYVLPSASEGLSVSLLEAGSLGLPVIVSDIPQNREIVGADGAYIPLGDISALQETLEHVMTDRETYQSKGAKLQERVRATYSWDAVVSQLETVYQSSVRPAKHNAHTYAT